MTESKAKKYVARPLIRPDTKRAQKSVSVILSDSKGFYVHNELEDDLINIVWWCRRGAGTGSQFTFLTNHLPDLLPLHKQIVIYIWLGTCDVTRKVGVTKSIELRSENTGETLNYLKLQYSRIIDYCRQYSTVQLVFLELPPYSIGQWNSTKCGANPADYKAQDELLMTQINTINEHIRTLNADAGVRSPKFGLDILHYRKSRNNRQFVNLNTGLLLDGVHPKAIVAKVWMRKILLRCYIDCY